MLRHASYNVNQPAATSADAVYEYMPAPAQEPTAQAEPVYSASPRRKAEPKPHPDTFHIAKGWIDTADRTRTWNLLDPEGNKIAEFYTKRDASKLADILNDIKPDERGRSR